MRALTVIALLLVAAGVRADESASAVPAALAAVDHARSDSYLGFAVGVGAGRMELGNESWGFDELLGPLHSYPLAIRLFGGRTLSERALVGLEFGMLRVDGHAHGAAVRIRLTDDFDIAAKRAYARTVSLSLVGTSFPWRRGPFFRVGAGIASFRVQYDDGHTGARADAETGVQLLAGAGWAFWTGARANLIVDVEAALQTFPHQSLNRSHTIASHVGVAWY
jgi:hypothetical protein